MLQALAFHSLEIRTPGGKSPNKRVMAICLHMGLLYVFSVLVVLYTWTEKANVFPPRLLPHFVYNLMCFLVRFLSLQIPCSVPGHSSSKLSNLQFNQEAEPRPLSCRMKVVKGDVLLLGIIWPARGGEKWQGILTNLYVLINSLDFENGMMYSIALWFVTFSFGCRVNSKTHGFHGLVFTDVITCEVPAQTPLS